YDSAEHRQGLCITTAHELGHEFGLGHPDEGRLPAPLPGTNHRLRLMASGTLIPDPKKRKTQLVKGEWDKIAVWIEELEAAKATP
ncbi:hypothetical protein, partial [Roseibacillus persicicus]|uniref:hypothetical protein n=1 Tax=Roseibacillus persicicus TaxID=454148 RepID=UPI00280C7B63